ncbi:MAG: hypothetical protein ACI9HU_000248 [Colwellia sp.]|jgi:hypothetical protein
MVDFTPQWRVMPYDIYGVKLFAVEKGSYTDCYLDARVDAEERVKALKEQDK